MKYAPILLAIVAAPAVAQTPDIQLAQEAAAPDILRDTLAEAVDSALMGNPDLAAQRAVTGQAAAQLDQARAGALPQIGLSGSYGWERTEVGQKFSLFGTQFPQDGSSERAQVGLEARQVIYAGGAIAARTRQARAGLTAADAQLAAVERDVILSVVSAYLDVRRAEEEVLIRETNVDSLGQQVQAAKDRFDVGEVTRTDVAQAEARLAGSQAELASARAGLEAQRAVYEAVVGRPPVQLANPPPPPAIPGTLAEALAAASVGNAEIMAARASETAATEGVKAAKGDYRPRIDLRGVAGLTETYRDDSFQDTNLGLSAQLSIPLYQGGLLSARTKQARFAADQARYMRMAAERRVTVQVTNSWHRVIAAREAIRASTSRVAAAEVAMEGAQQELAVGTRTTLDVLDQERELLDARLNLINSERAGYLAIHELLGAAGGLTGTVFGR
jgi:outer membrane protein